MATGLNTLGSANQTSTLGLTPTSQVRSEQTLKVQRIQQDKYEATLSKDTLEISDRARALSEGNEEVPRAEPAPLEDEQRFARTARNNKRLEEQTRHDNTINASLEAPGESGGNTLSRINAHQAGRDEGVPTLSELFAEAATAANSPDDLEAAQAGLAQLPPGESPSNVATAATRPEPTEAQQENTRETQERREEINLRAEERFEETEEVAEETFESRQTDLNDNQRGFPEARFFEAAGQLGRPNTVGQTIDLAA